MTNEDKDKVAKSGLAAGTVMTGTGALLVGGSKATSGAFKGLKSVSPEKTRELRKAIKGVAESRGKTVSQMVKGAGNAGKLTLAAAVPLTAVSAYKHHKNKKKTNDSTEK